MKPAAIHQLAQRAFTLLELLCVITVIAILAGLIMPVYQNTTQRAYDTKCMNNLRQIGLAANSAANDNDNTYPLIEIDGNTNMVNDILGDPNAPVLTLPEALKPYGITQEVLKCPADLKTNNYYAQQNPNSSYMWSPYSEDDSSLVPTIFSRRRGQVQISPSRLQLASDWSAVHFASDGKLGDGKMIYVVYGDGHVRTTRRPSPQKK